VTAREPLKTFRGGRGKRSGRGGKEKKSQSMVVVLFSKLLTNQVDGPGPSMKRTLDGAQQKKGALVLKKEKRLKGKGGELETTERTLGNDHLKVARKREEKRLGGRPVWGKTVPSLLEKKKGQEFREGAGKTGLKRDRGHFLGH